MKKLITQKVIIASIVLGAVVNISWGIFGHEHINRAAVFALPASMQGFFYNHIDYITQESTVPDVRKYTINDKAESPRHYIDLENYAPLDSIPQTLELLKAKYPEKYINQNGILYWYLQDMMVKLTKAFKERKKTEILFLAADLGHYIGDAHMPLHTSANYDGQMTNQKGIHALWESRIPELFGKNYNMQVGEAVYIENIQQETWNIIMHSHKLVDTLLSVDKDLKSKFSKEKIYKLDNEGKPIKNKYGNLLFADSYTEELHKALNGMVENQMKLSIAATASFWYTAWVNAGRPDLTSLDPAELTSRNKKNLLEELELIKTGKLFGIESENEF